MQILEENIRKYLCGLELGKDFLNRTLKLLIPEENNDKMDHTKIKNFLPKDFFNRVKRQTTKCGRKRIPDKGGISRFMSNSY